MAMLAYQSQVIRTVVEGCEIVPYRGEAIIRKFKSVFCLPFLHPQSIIRKAPQASALGMGHMGVACQPGIMGVW